jgi:hypothetical protein
VGNPNENNMSDKKRTIVITTETHEVWIIRRAVPEDSEVELLRPLETSEPAPVPPLRELNSSSETDE